MAVCEETVFPGEPAYRAGNDRLERTLVPGWGSNGISLFSRERSRQLLRVPRSVEEYRSSPFLYGIPVLFPPDRIGDGRFTFQRRTYRLKINERGRCNHFHGGVYQRGREPVKAEASGSSRWKRDLTRNNIRRFTSSFRIRSLCPSGTASKVPTFTRRHHPRRPPSSTGGRRPFPGALAGTGPFISR